MANFRQIHVSIWKDPWFLELDANEKLLFIYLFSNESASLAGIYEIAFRVICFETNLDAEFVKDTLNKFEGAGKVKFKDGIVWVKNMRKYNSSTSDKVAIRINKDLQEIPECPIKQDYIAYYNEVIPYIQPIDTLSLKEEEEYLINSNSIGSEAGGGLNAVAKISAHYESNVGTLNSKSADIINEWVNNYPYMWITKAIDEAKKNKAKHPNYVTAILDRWLKDGFNAARAPAAESQEAMFERLAREED